MATNSVRVEERVCAELEELDVVMLAQSGALNLVERQPGGALGLDAVQQPVGLVGFHQVTVPVGSVR